MADEDEFTGEARRFLDAMQEWTREWAQRAMPAPPSGHPGPECQWCPLCQLASVLRGEHPELAERVAEAGAALASAMKALLDSTLGAGLVAPQPPAPTNRRRPRPGPGIAQGDT